MRLSTHERDRAKALTPEQVATLQREHGEMVTALKALESALDDSCFVAIADEHGYMREDLLQLGFSAAEISKGEDVSPKVEDFLLEVGQAIDGLPGSADTKDFAAIFDLFPDCIS